MSAGGDGTLHVQQSDTYGAILESGESIEEDMFQQPTWWETKTKQLGYLMPFLRGHPGPATDSSGMKVLSTLLTSSPWARLARFEFARCEAHTIGGTKITLNLWSERAGAGKLEPAKRKQQRGQSVGRCRRCSTSCLEGMKGGTGAFWQWRASGTGSFSWGVPGGCPSASLHETHHKSVPFFPSSCVSSHFA